VSACTIRMDGSRRVEGWGTACTHGWKGPCILVSATASRTMTISTDFAVGIRRGEIRLHGVFGVGGVDEAGGVTPERPRRFAQLASFSLQSFAAAPTQRVRRVGIPGEDHFGSIPHSSSGPDVSVALPASDPNVPDRPDQGLCQQGSQNKTLESAGGH
jgi:hypothetical protein